MTVIGPDAAAAILQAYKDGLLPMQRGKTVKDAPDAEAYVRNDEPLWEEIRERRRKKECVDDVSLVRESDFHDHHLMNRIFFKNAGPGPGRLTLAGIVVHKDIRSFPSNSGRRPDTGLPSPGRAAMALHEAPVRAFHPRRSTDATTRNGTGGSTSDQVR
ncbi:hypothetical protein QTL95_18240 [Rhizobium sp. S152]|uniref:hypothetical protein n=1 Tax=Rhizobium sp. S152 TaxID=3055038 RepID=UPI0025A95045|nr:hypothetical protein [Rhizobium sp. S152]MDM9627834.1 hypothetical protein [Rhizobium sp. S152]